MNCQDCKEALSARLDGEPEGVDAQTVDLHLQRCERCRTWLAEAESVHRALRLIPAPAIPDLTAPILAAAAEPPPGPELSTLLRAGLVLVAAVQLALGLPYLLGMGGTTHGVTESGAFNVALALGFLVAAFRPARAWGMAPLVGAAVVCLVGNAALHVGQGHASAASESTHLVAAAGFVLLLGLVRIWPRPFAVARPVAA